MSRVQEIAGEMEMINDNFDVDKAADDWDYLMEYQTQMRALADELITIQNTTIEELRKKYNVKNI